MAGWLTIVSCAAVFDVGAGVNSWSGHGPYGGANSVAFAGGTGQIVYASTLHSLYRSEDGGATWTLRNGDVSPTAIRSMVADPTDPNKLYLSISILGLYRSTDGGLTFTGNKTLPAIASPSLSKFDPSWLTVSRDGKHIYYTTYVGLFFASHDAGATWQGGLGAALGRIAIDPSDPLIVYVAPLSVADVRKSIDGGASWNTLIGPSTKEVFSIQVVPGNPNSLWVSTVDGVYVTVDDGAHWNLSLPLQNAANLTADPHEPGSLLAIAADQSTYLYSSGSWAKLRGSAQSSAREVAISPANSQRLLRASERLDVSNDRGATWSASDEGIIGSSPGPLATGAGRVYATVGSELYSATDESGWKSLATPTPGTGFITTIAAHPTDPQSIFLAGAAGNYFRTSDGGTSWTPGPAVQPALLATHATFDPVDPSIVYMSAYDLGAPPTQVGDAGHVFRSTDAGASFSEVLSTPLSLVQSQLAVDPTDHRRVYLAGPYDLASQSNYAQLWRTSNSGGSWAKLNSNTAYAHGDIALDPSKAGRIYVINAGLRLSEDGGDSWAAVDGAGNATNVAVDPVVGTVYVQTTASAQSGWIAGYPLLRSVDQGKSWETLPVPVSVPTSWQPLHVVLDALQPGVVFASINARGMNTFQVSPDLDISIAGHSGSRTINTGSTFDATVRNAGPYAASAVKVALTVPASMQGVSATINAGTCSAAVGSIQCQAPFLKLNEQLAVHVAYNTTAVGELPVHATVSMYEKDSTTANNTADATAMATNVVVASGGKKGGGGSTEWLLLAVLSAVAAVRRRRHAV